MGVIVPRKEECLTTLQSGHPLYHYDAANGQAGIAFNIDTEMENSITRVTSNNSTYMIMEKQSHYTIVMGDFNKKAEGHTHTRERSTGGCAPAQRDERGDTLVEWVTSNKLKIINSQF